VHAQHDARHDARVASGRRGAARKLAVIAILITLVLAFAPPAHAQTGAEDPAAESRAALQLAQKYAPIMMLKQQDEACDRHGEQFAPTAVDIVLNNPEVALRQVGRGDPVVMWGPGEKDLFNRGAGFYLDFPGHALDPGCLYEKDFRRYGAEQPTAVYAHIATQPDRPGELALQYWFFWYFNLWNNKHESDWEGIQLVFPASSAQEALTVEPTGVGYAQHEGGERSDWDDSKLDREGSRVIVFSSSGSHASYYGSALYLGRNGKEGFGCDNTDGPSVRVDPSVVMLPSKADAASDDQSWISFAGRWGERASGAFNGPNGPSQKKRWTKPMDWYDDLRSSSALVPTGDAQAAIVVDSFCRVVGWGSNELIQLQTSPTRVFLSGVVLTALVVVLLKRTSWNRVDALPVVRRRRAGSIVRAAFPLYRRHVATFAAIGLIALVVAAIAGLVVAVVNRLPFLGSLLAPSDAGGGSRFALALTVGGFANATAYVATGAAVAAALGAAEVGRPPRADAIVDALTRRARALAGAYAIALVVIGLLFLSFFLIPVALWLLVRIQFFPQAVMSEGLGGFASLRRSSDLVRGRWISTALIVGAVHLATLCSGLVVGLVVLVLFTSLPMWGLSLVVTLVGALALPLGAIIVTLLYGDARAEFEERAELVPVAR
jgi:hypothetical protein